MDLRSLPNLRHLIGDLKTVPAELQRDIDWEAIAKDHGWFEGDDGYYYREAESLDEADAELTLDANGIEHTEYTLLNSNKELHVFVVNGDEAVYAEDRNMAEAFDRAFRQLSNTTLQVRYVNERSQCCSTWRALVEEFDSDIDEDALVRLFDRYVAIDPPADTLITTDPEINRLARVVRSLKYSLILLCFDEKDADALNNALTKHALFV